ncbi:TIGR03943 family putative permease subunit [Bacillus sp. T33-2]|uniref:TIGR03943 family putative permease subunit n=1 Tax=Bacillus sp. T33-2 TaxID=2054168 RepID=UPI000C790276|nr:TIGR03943 family protein [Bacillus sp. T33-2]PLR91668.1 TIGR03943 family protein [Bacillus sp. T33-2]
MVFHFQQAVRALILLSFTAFIFKLHVSGEITKYINPKYIGLSQAASVIFLILFFIQITRIWKDKKDSHDHCDHDESCSHHHDHGDSEFNIKKLVSYGIIVFPLITGFLLPAKVLDASIADKKGGMAMLANKKQETENERTGNIEENTNEDDNDKLPEVNDQPDNAATDNPADPGSQKEISQQEYEQLMQHLLISPVIKMDDYVFSSYYDEISQDISKFKGRKIELKGFVYKEEGFQQDQLVISRFLITHCVADASIIGFLSQLPDASKLEQDTWIEASGVLETTNYNGAELPMIKIDSWKKISQPDEPYLYPINIRIL